MQILSCSPIRIRSFLLIYASHKVHIAVTRLILSLTVSLKTSLSISLSSSKSVYPTVPPTIHTTPDVFSSVVSNDHLFCGVMYDSKHFFFREMLTEALGNIRVCKDAVVTYDCLSASVIHFFCLS